MSEGGRMETRDQAKGKLFWQPSTTGSLKFVSTRGPVLCLFVFFPRRFRNTREQDPQNSQHSVAFNVLGEPSAKAVSGLNQRGKISLAKRRSASSYPRNDGEEDTLCKFPGVLYQPPLRRLDPALRLDFWKPRPKRRPHDSIARPAIELRRVIAFASWGWAGCVRRRPARFQAPPGSISSIGRIRRPKSFHFLREPHVMFHISRIKARMCLRVSASQIWPATLQKPPLSFPTPFPPPLPPPPFLPPPPTPSICALFILLQPRLVFVFFSSYLSFSLSPPSRSAAPAPSPFFG